MNPYDPPTERSELPEEVRLAKQRRRRLALIATVTIAAVIVLQLGIGDNARNYALAGLVVLGVLYDALRAVRVRHKR